MYYYFDGKEDLFGAVIDHAVSLFVARNDAFEVDDVSADRYWVQLDELARDNMAMLQAHPWIAGVARAVLNGRIDAPGGHLRVGFQRWTQQYLARGQELGLVRTDLPLELLVAAVVATGETVDRWMLAHWESEPDRVDSNIPLAIDLLRRLVEPGTPTESN